MRGSKNRLSGIRERLCSIVFGLVVQGFVLQSEGQIITLTDKSSTAQVNVGSQAGMFNWTVNGINQLSQQWFWYRVGSAGPEQAINTISAPIVTTPNARTLYARYDNGLYSVEVDYLLTGSAPGTNASSDISESITLANHTAAPLVFHFFQYSDFDLGGDPAGDTVQLGKNLSGRFNEADQSKPGIALTETVVTPGANHGEAALFSSTLNKLNDANPDNLNDNSGPTGPGDVTWALQWDFTIAAGGSVGITKDKYLQLQGVPEPSVVAVLFTGLLVWTFHRRRHSA